MAWSTPSTRSTGYKVTAANWNELVNDLTYLYGAVGSGALLSDRQEITASATASKSFVAITGGSAKVTVTLPTAWVATVGKLVVIKDEFGIGSAYNVAVVGQGAETVEGGATAIMTDLGVVCYYSDGTQWLLWSRTIGGGAPVGTASLRTIATSAAYPPGTASSGSSVVCSGSDHVHPFQERMENAIINGCMRFSQRGASFTSATMGVNNDDSYTLDRWNLLSDGNDIVDVSQETSVIPTGGYAALKLDIETANKKAGVIQFIERKHILPLQVNGQCSLQYKASKAVGNATVDKLRAAVLAWSSTADAVTSDVVSAWEAEGTSPTLIANWTYENAAESVTLTDSYQTFKIEGITLDAASTTNLAVFIWIDNADATVGDLVYITDVELVPGVVCPTYEARVYADEERLCHRYFQSYGGASAYESVCVGHANSTTVGWLVLQPNVPMRTASPSITLSDKTHWALLRDNGGWEPLSANPTTASYSSSGRILIGTTVAGNLAANAAVVLGAAGTTSARFWLSSEM